jgi:hypothetical protein
VDPRQGHCYVEAVPLAWSALSARNMSTMGYNVEPAGRLNLSESDDAAAVAAAEAACAERDGWFNPELFPRSETLADTAWVAAASITRDGDWIELSHSEGDPKWSNQATAFYVAIAPFVRSGIVHIHGEDGARWSYTYADGQVTQQGRNGWDGSIEPFGEHLDHPEAPAAVPNS